MSNIRTPQGLILPPGLRRELNEQKEKETNNLKADADFIDKVVESLREDIEKKREEICLDVLSKGWTASDVQLKEIFGINEDNTLRYEVYFIHRNTGERLTEDELENGKPKPDVEPTQ